MMRVLVLYDRPPHPDASTTGDQLAYNRLRLLAPRYEITCAYVNWLDEPAAADGSALYPYRLVNVPVPNKDIVPRIHYDSRAATMYHAWRHALVDSEPLLAYNRRQPALAAALRELVESVQPDVIHVVGLAMLYAMPTVTPPVIAEIVDTWSRAHWRRADQFHKPTHRVQHWLEGTKIERLEREGMKRARAVIVTSEQEAATVRRLTPGKQVFIIPPAVELERFLPQPECEEAAALVFTGSMEYPPNIEAAQLFARDIFPRVKQAAPQARWYIVGRYPTPEVLALAREDTIVTGAVESILPYYARATVCVVPILHGGGVRNKILEAWAMQRAVVSTTLGAESCGAVDGENILLADDAVSFANAVVRLLQNPALRERLGKNGFKVVQENFTLESAAEKMGSIFQELSAAA